MSAASYLLPARRAGALREVDYYLATHLLALVDCTTPSVALAVAALSKALGEGSSCLALPQLASGILLIREPAPDAAGQAFTGLPAPPLAEWRAALEASRLVAPSPSLAAGYPLVLDAAHRLYFNRHFNQERRVAESLAARAQARPYADASTTRIEAALDREFPPGAHDPDQRAAVRLALERPFAVITGGPGTGKTTTVARLLALMAALGRPDELPTILAAPTGKAANRLVESIAAAGEHLRAAGTPAADLARIPGEARTLHRLLGMRAGRQGPRYHGGNPLPLGVLVIDEASMVDLNMMARVLEALPSQARLVLLGDADQLASVEAGAVLGDLCEAARLGDHAYLSALTHSHRFREDGGIGRLAGAIRTGDLEATVAALAEDVDTRLDAGGLAALAARAIPAWRDYLTAGNPAEALAGFGRFRVLCALREGAQGVGGVTSLLEHALAAVGLIAPVDRYYRGRPVIVTANDYTVELFNGDVGLLWPDAAGVMRAWFPGAQGEPRAVPINRLPAHETAYAMTVHRAQGSEFDEVALVLPNHESAVLTRELLYTAVTRARHTVVIHASSPVLAMALGRPVARASGLRDALLQSLQAARD